jgi:hypothetical protein
LLLVETKFVDLFFHNMFQIKKWFPFFLFFLVTHLAFGQKYTISGHVKDASNGEEMIAASIAVKGQMLGAVTNNYGFYSLTIDKGEYTIIYRFVGYDDIEKKVILNKNTTIDIELVASAKEMKTAVVSAKKIEQQVENKKISVVKMDIETIKAIPVLFGEVDIMKTITFMPGIQSAGEGNSGINVRGGGQDQNLILLDEAPVYNASHLLGFFSVFNGDAIKDLEVYKGGIPAKYGGRLSSLIDVRMKDGNKKHMAATGGIGLISSRLTVEGPIKKDVSSFMVAGRRSYADLFLPLAPNKDLKENKLYFYDLNAKANYTLGKKDRLYLSGYFGRDVFKFSKLFGLDWGNSTATLRWNHLFNEKLFSNVTFIYSDFNYKFDFDFGDQQNLSVSQGITDWSLKADFTNYLSPKSKLEFGVISTHHTFNPGLVEPLRSTSIFSKFQYPERKALESAVYVDHEYKFTTRFKARYGLRMSMFNNLGSANEFRYARDEFGAPTALDTFTYRKNEFYNTYVGFEPRAALSYNITSEDAIKASYDRTYQYLQQASNTASTIPTDQWIPANINIKPQVADQVALGYFKNFKKSWEASIEVYYKKMKNQIDYRDGALLFFNEQIDAELLIGDAWSYGTELFIKRSGEKFNGFLSYTLAKTQRQIAGINYGNAYPTQNDRRHNLNLVGMYKFSNRLSASATFVLQSGRPVTFPARKYSYDGLIIPHYDSRNSFRMPVYHRADVGVTWENKKKEGKRFESSWNLSVYNVYSRANAYSIVFREKTAIVNGETVNTGETEAVQIALFKIIPSITWNFKF